MVASIVRRPYRATRRPSTKTRRATSRAPVMDSTATTARVPVPAGGESAIHDRRERGNTEIGAPPRSVGCSVEKVVAASTAQVSGLTVHSRSLVDLDPNQRRQRLSCPRYVKYTSYSLIAVVTVNAATTPGTNDCISNAALIAIIITITIGNPAAVFFSEKLNIL